MSFKQFKLATPLAAFQISEITPTGDGATLKDEHGDTTPVTAEWSRVHHPRVGDYVVSTAVAEGAALSVIPKELFEAQYTVIT